MTEQNKALTPTFTLAPREKLALATALTRDYEAFLAPGERVALQADASADYTYAQIVLERADKRARLDLEAVMLSQDQESDPEPLEPRVAIDLLLDFLRVHLYEFFRQDRQHRFHVDWRLYPFEDRVVRLRGSLTSPELLSEADALLDAHPEAD